jgi:hypothetical protein
VLPLAPTPAAVTNLAAASRDGQATLTWSPAANATAYYVYVKNISAGETGFTQLPIPVTGSPWTAGLLVNGASYEFKLQSINGIQRGDFSNTASVVPLAPTPAGVTDLAATAGDGEVILQWSPAAHATSYYVSFRNVWAGETNWTTTPVAFSGPTFPVRGLLNGFQYEFRLQSNNGLQRGEYSNIATAKPQAPPGQPTGGAAGCTHDGICISTVASGQYIFTVSGGVAVKGGGLQYKNWCGQIRVTFTYQGRTLRSRSSSTMCGDPFNPVFWVDNVYEAFPDQTQVCLWGDKSSGTWDAGGPACETIRT